MYTHLKPESQGKTGLGTYADGLVEHDGHVGKLLDKLEQLGLAEDTLVVYTTDNGPMACMWPDSGQTPFRGEKDTGFEGAFRVPALVRWPGVIKPGTVFTDMMAGQDWLPTFLAVAGDSDIVTKCRKGHQVGDLTYKVHLDGYDQTDMLTGKGPSKRHEFFYFSDDGELLAARFGRIKAHFEMQRAQSFSVWVEPFDKLRVPQVFDLKIDPLEKGDDGINYQDWQIRRVFVLVPIQEAVAKFYETFEEFPVRQAPSSFTIKQVTLMPEVGPAVINAGATSHQ
jgi:arylsulfatase